MKTDPKAAVFWVGVGGAVWKPAKQVLVGKLKEQGDRAVSSELCYRVLTGTRARIWVNGFYDVGERPSQTCECYTEPLGQGILYSRMRVVPLPRLSLQVFPAFLVSLANYT